LLSTIGGRRLAATVKRQRLAIAAALVTALCIAAVSVAQVGAAADKGAAAAKKKKSKRGPAGPQGPQGPAGPLVDTLPAGKTLRGAYAVGGPASAGSQFFFSQISFPFPLAAKPSSNVVNGGSTPACPGSVADPQAASGNLCIYVQKAVNGSVSSCDPVLDLCNQTSRFGAVIEIFSSATGTTFSQGTWAVTG
jgi:hypothetical protein